MTPHSAFLAAAAPPLSGPARPRLCRTGRSLPAAPRPLRSARPPPTPPTAPSRNAPRATLDDLRVQNVQRVDPETGDRVDSGGVEVVELFGALPKGDIPQLGETYTRSAEAVLFVRADVLEGAHAADPPPLRAVLFMHGFSQRPRNYGTTLRLLAARGYVVAAPRVWFLDFLLPWARVPGAGARASMAAKLQTALLLDAFRTLQFAERAFNVASFALAGHSMGAVMALVAARAAAQDARLAGVVALAPAVGPAARTPLNPFLTLAGGGDLPKFFAEFGDTPVLCLHGTRDLIVPGKDVTELFDALAEGRDRTAVALRGEIAGGSHVGFEDTLRVDLRIFRFLDILIFKLIDAIVFGPADAFFKNEQQLKLTKILLPPWLEASAENADVVWFRALVDQLDIPADEVAFTWDGVPGRRRPAQFSQMEATNPEPA